jgi:hypothetical protein
MMANVPEGSDAVTSAGELGDALRRIARDLPRMEVAYATTTVAVRDSKNPTGPVLSVAAFAAFVRDVKSGRINY